MLPWSPPSATAIPKPHITVPVLATSTSTNSPFTLLLLSVRPSVLLRCRSWVLATILAADPVLSLLLSALSINQSIKQQQQQKTSTVAAEQIPSDVSSTTRQTAASCSSSSFFFLFLFLQFFCNNRRREMLCCCYCYWIFFSIFFFFFFLGYLQIAGGNRQTDGHKGHRHDNAHARPRARAEGVAWVCQERRARARARARNHGRVPSLPFSPAPVRHMEPSDEGSNPTIWSGSI